ncbi:hypothetical protein B0A49_13631 [Cryomyces minteri]|uniref:Phosphotyrosine protein phosphatase I domain-containing protein n=1 Tax=Cryomyces minteri TaxID=331657 RepID=A0A4U0VDG6_9PEZI|nr:hypothetical protein B0A49_13586 [Cryomyces minteri]TKA47397.1 hypothetical protein B0A49_13631 [Cryomyces minteri]
MGAVTIMISDHRIQFNKVTTFLSKMLENYPKLRAYARPRPETDILFKADYNHVDGNDTCKNCDKSRVEERMEREPRGEPFVHYGLIASGNRVMKDAVERDRLSKDSGGAMCFEMEAAGLMNDFRCVVIRGIADYADSHKNDAWHAYASASAAALAKELLSYMDSKEVTENLPQIGTIDSAGAGSVFDLMLTDPRTAATLYRHGISDTRRYPRQITPADFANFTYILAMDGGTLRRIRDFQSNWPNHNRAARTLLFGNFGEHESEEVMDPYFEGQSTFEDLFMQLTRLSLKFLEHVLGMRQT